MGLIVATAAVVTTSGDVLSFYGLEVAAQSMRGAAWSKMLPLLRRLMLAVYLNYLSSSKVSYFHSK